MILRPNYFVGIQVSNPEIHQVVKMVQEVILSKEPALRTTLSSIPTLHITLAATHLRDIEHVNRAAEMVEKCVSDYKEFFSKSTSLHFSGLHTFGDKVLFAGIQQGDVLEEVALMAKDLEVSFQELTGFATKKGFKPHLTILKLSKDLRLRKKGISKISSNLYSDISNTVFGTQTVKGIQLLSMNKPKDENGYYFCSHQVTFDVSCSESNDHTECCKKPLSVKPELKNVSDLKQTLKEDKNIIKRRFHSLSMAGLSSVFGSANEPPVQRDSLLKTLLIIGAVTGAIIAIVRGMSSNK
ncbi:A-kinase anchor protein 7-like isoform X2 [Periplaneta americana]